MTSDIFICLSKELFREALKKKYRTLVFDQTFETPPPMQTLAQNQIFLHTLNIVYNNITRITMSSGLNVLSTLVLNS